MTLYKIGKTQNLKNRLLKYNTDKKDDLISSKYRYHQKFYK
jgi:hypothetical protein